MLPKAAVLPLFITKWSIKQIGISKCTRLFTDPTAIILECCMWKCLPEVESKLYKICSLRVVAVSVHSHLLKEEEDALPSQPALSRRHIWSWNTKCSPSWMVQIGLKDRIISFSLAVCTSTSLWQPAQGLLGWSHFGHWLSFSGGDMLSSCHRLTIQGLDTELTSSFSFLHCGITPVSSQLSADHSQEILFPHEICRLQCGSWGLGPQMPIQMDVCAFSVCSDKFTLCLRGDACFCAYIGCGDGYLVRDSWAMWVMMISVPVGTVKLSLCAWVKFGPLLSSVTLPDRSFAELVDLIRGGLKKESEVNRWQT